MLRYLLTRSLRETAFPQNEHQTTAPAYARRFSARNWIIPSAYASAYALALLQFAYASLRKSGFGLREASYDTTLSTHVKGGLGRCSVDFDGKCRKIYHTWILWETTTQIRRWTLLTIKQQPAQRPPQSAFLQHQPSCIV